MSYVVVNFFPIDESSALDFVVIEGSVVAEEVATVLKATGERVDGRSLLRRELFDALAPPLVF